MGVERTYRLHHVAREAEHEPDRDEHGDDVPETATPIPEQYFGDTEADGEGEGHDGRRRRVHWA
jgi:hypothetical protein